MPDCSRHLVESLRSGRAQYRVFTIAQPAAGAGFAFTVDSLGWLQILAIRFSLTTDATVINRVPRIDYRDGDGNDLARFPVSAGIPAGNAAFCSFISDYFPATVITSASSSTALVGWLLMSGWVVAGTVYNIQAADQISLIRVTALDWVTLTDAQTVVAERMEDL